MKNSDNRKKTAATKYAAALLFIGLQAALLTACGSSGSTETGAAYATTTAYDYDGGAEYYEEAAYDDAAVEESVDVEAAQTYSEDRKLIKTVDISLETENYDSLLSGLETKVTELGGYIESRYSSNSSYQNPSYSGSRELRYTSMTVRMPKDKLDTFLDSVSEQTNVVSISENVEDVTLQYVDMESHKKALATEQERLLELLEQAQTVEDIISIEDRLSQVRYQIESMESQLRTYDNKIDYSTVYLTINEVEQYSPTEGETIGERIRNGFLDSMEGVKDGVTEFAIWFVVKLPYLVVWAIVIAVIVFIFSKIRKHIRKKHAQKAAAPRLNPYVQPAQPYGQTVNPYAQQGNSGIQQPVPDYGTGRENRDTTENRSE
jgi:hypothetical protein